MIHGRAHAFSLKPCQFAEVMACPEGALCADSPYAKIEITRRGKQRIHLRFTSPVKTAVKFFENRAALLAVTGPDGKRLRHARDKFTLPAAAGAEYLLTTTRAK